ncbi:DUF4367 domain-containing protein [Salimicrobium flavidum]|uniref:DUF4367 domain-containing protein n=1 Tax=Salimicrobium flavidum TaxID=570947 RepID=A0A1N7J8H9_9BACI|nr:DUF4367 domain-containing protein [Salimicrobium flavidum]SIS45536.1 protein of unknown function [Salimicrobium flavidum]
MKRSLGMVLLLIFLGACNDSSESEKLYPEEEGVHNGLIVYDDETDGFENPEFLQNLSDTLTDRSKLISEVKMMTETSVTEQYENLDVPVTPYYIFFDMNGVAIETQDKQEAEDYLLEEAKSKNLLKKEETTIDYASDGLSYESVAEELEQFDFDYRLPSELPFDVKSIDVTSPSPNQPIMMVDYMGAEGGEFLSLMVTATTINTNSDTDKEEVELNGVTGKYYVNEQGARFLVWEKKDVSYQLTAHKDSQVDQNDLLSIGKSMK